MVSSSLIQNKVHHLKSLLDLDGSQESVCASLTQIKHEIIGNKVRKQSYLKADICSVLIRILDKSLELNWDNVQVEVCVLLGSFAAGSALENAVSLVCCDSITPLFHVFSYNFKLLMTESDNLRYWALVEVSLRSLKSIFSLSALTLPLDKTFPSTTEASLASLTNLTTFGGMDIKSTRGTCAELLFGPSPLGHASHLAHFLQNPPRPSTADATRMLVSTLILCARCISLCTRDEVQQNKLCAIGTVPALLSLLDQSGPLPALTQAVLDCLASLLRGNAAACRAFASSGELSDRLLALLQTSCPETRLAVTTCMVHIYKAKLASAEYEQQRVLKVMLPTLIKLIDEPRLPLSLRCRAPLVLAILLADDENLQKAAMEGDAIPKVASLLVNTDADEIKARVHNTQPQAAPAAANPVKDPLQHASTDKKAGEVSLTELEAQKPGLNGRIVAVPGVLDPLPAPKGSTKDQSKTTGLFEVRRIEGSLLAIAAICGFREECRKQVIDAKLLPAVVDALTSKHVAVRAAACLCIRSLSRSVKHLRTSLVDVGVAAPLFELLKDPSLQVQVSASAALCNLVLDFSPMKRYLMSCGGVQQLVNLIYCSDENLRLNALWGLKNLLFQADSAMKKEVMDRLTFGTLDQLLCDARLDMQEQALNLVRNLACGSEEDISAVFAGLGTERLFDILESKLVSLSDHDAIVLQTLYTLVNIATGNQAQKAALMSRSVVLDGMLRCMFHLNAKVRVASIWIIINLTWVDDPGSSDRIKLLMERKIDFELLALLNDPCLDVKERAKTAIEHFNYVSDGKDSMQIDERPKSVPTSAGASPVSGGSV